MAKSQKTVQHHKAFVPVDVRANSVNADERTVDLVFSTGSKVKRYSYAEGYYMEELSMDPSHIRLGRLNQGASFLDTHDQWDMNARLGAVVPGSARIENGQGICTVKLSRGHPIAERILQDLSDGMPLPISVGYKVYRFEKSEGENGELPTMRATDWEPMEVSAVPIPADAGAMARSEESNRDANDCEIVLTREDETAPAEVTEPAAEVPPAQPSSETEAAAEAARSTQEEIMTTTPAAATSPADETRNAPVDTSALEAATRTAEATRAADILDLGTRHNWDAKKIQAAIREGKSVNDVRAAILDDLAAGSERGAPVIATTVPAEVSGSRQDETDTRRRLMTNALEHRVDPSAVKLEDGARQYRGMTMLDMVRDIQEVAGQSVRGLTKMELAERAFHTTSDFPIILAGVINRRLRAGYDASPQTFKPFSRQRTATDFRDMHSIQVGEVGDLKKLNENGEYISTTLGESSQKYRIATYGRIIGVTRQVLVNDDLGIFTNLAAKFGNAVSRLESNVVWDIILKNQKMGDGKALFHADHGNLAGGAGLPPAAALSHAAIQAGRIAMSKQTDIDGKDRIGITPKYLLLPQELELDAAKLFAQFNPTTFGDTVPEFVKNLTPIVEHRLGDISATNWHLVADPAQIDTIEYAYLEGQEGPYTETEQGFDVDGMRVKVRMDFGASAIDHRGFFRNPGA